MKDPYPLLLAAIVALCVALMAVAVVLICTGHGGEVAGVSAIFMPVIMLLVAAKLDMLRRQNVQQNRKLEEIHDQTNGNFSEVKEKLKSANAEIKRLKEP